MAINMSKVPNCLQHALKGTLRNELLAVIFEIDSATNILACLFAQKVW